MNKKDRRKSEHRLRLLNEMNVAFLADELKLTVQYKFAQIFDICEA